MKYYPDKHNRRSIRLKGYDYSEVGHYFVTLCTYNRERLFGYIKNGVMILNEYGITAESTWNDLPNHNRQIQMDEFIIMPNHIHGVIIINKVPEIVGAGSEPAPTETKSKHQGLPEIVRQFKTFSARRINDIRKTTGSRIWQRNYYEHIVRDENELDRIRKYIVENPFNWDFDGENPHCKRTG